MLVVNQWCCYFDSDVCSYRYFPVKTKASCPAFWGVAPRSMKIGSEDSKAYFRINSQSHERGSRAEMALNLQNDGLDISDLI
jgi:hypothetical protein